jgi:glycosyltransferase involved in cell wall biosynthesis
MRIALIAPPWLPVPSPGYGGTETVIDHLARGLDDAGHSVLLVSHSQSLCPVDRVSVVPAADTVQMGRGSIELEHVVGAYRLIAGCDVVHDHTLAGALHAAAHPSVPVVATNHNRFDRTRVAVYSAVGPNVGVVAISRSHAASTSLPIAAVIHHGVHVEDFPFGAGTGGYAAVLSRMSPDKGIDRAITIARRAGVPLRIAAKQREPLERAYFDECIRPLLGRDVEYLGELTSDEKLVLLADSMALLNPIRWSEPFGMAMVEALACGTPVVSSSSGAAPEIVEHGVSGMLGDSDDELATALGEVAKLDRRACRQRVAEHFSVDRMVRAYVDVYERQRDAVALGATRRASP